MRFTKHLLLSTFLALHIELPAPASVMPVSLRLSSNGPDQPGEPSTVQAHILPAVSLPFATFEVPQQDGWHVVDGASYWSGPLVQGQEVVVTFRVVRLNEQPPALYGRLNVMRDRSLTASLETEQILLRSPAEVVEGKTSPSARAAEVSVTVSGRFLYRTLAVRSKPPSNLPIRNARIQLVNTKFGADLFEQVCADGSTSNTGAFSLTSSKCGDLFDGPDVGLRLILDNSVVRLKKDGGLDPYRLDYARSADRNHAGGTIAFGDIVITSYPDPLFWKATRVFSMAQRGHEFMVEQAGEVLPKVTVLFPSFESTYMWGGFNEIRLHESWIFNPEAPQGETDFLHEYGHHVISTRGEFPFPDYNNGICDDETFPSHCNWEPEKQPVAWLEGWPDFFAAKVYERHSEAEKLEAKEYFRLHIETKPRHSTLLECADHLPADQFCGPEDQIQGFVASVLWDLTDSANDDQEATGDGQSDRFQMSFNALWQVYRNYHPRGPNTYALTVHELWNGLQQFHPNSINWISAVYREHRIDKPMPELETISLQATGTPDPRGTMTISATVRNTMGDSRLSAAAATSFRISFFLVPVSTSDPGVLLGAAIVPAGLAAGATTTITATLTPARAPSNGLYNLFACVDDRREVPERDEQNNCRSNGQQLTIPSQPPPAFP